jgi:CheY-like chemotaxis protein
VGLDGRGSVRASRALTPIRSGEEQVAAPAQVRQGRAASLPESPLPSPRTWCNEKAPGAHRCDRPPPPRLPAEVNVRSLPADASPAGPRRPLLLIVDDEVTILEMLGLTLPVVGFDVVLASSGPEAVELYRQRAGAIDLVLLNESMPRMNGPQVLGALLRINPAVRCCFTTGETDEALLWGRAVIHKPFTLDELTAAIRAALA